MMSDNRLELYFHIPFCVKKCDYCDFLSAPGSEKKMEQYMEALFMETAGRAKDHRLDTVSTIFIGGGTPSALPYGCIGALLEQAREHFWLASDAEITVEANPGTLSPRILSGFLEAGVNRLSIGLQSADNGLLASIGRIHTWEQFEDNFRLAREMGFRNINVDLMSGLPGQSYFQYRDTLEKVLGLKEPPEHISAYSLILEESTPLYDRYREGRLSLPDEDTERRMYQDTKEVLACHGYERYEISNYARPGFACRHNCGYWRRVNYLGLGLGAASLIGNVRSSNTRDMERYLRQPLMSKMEICTLSVKEQMEEFMFLGLRMTDGVGADEFADLFGRRLEEVYDDVIRKNLADGLLVWTGDERRGSTGQNTAGGRRLVLTDYGLDVSNYVMAQFLLDE